MIKITNDDAAMPLFNKLIHRERMNVIEVADTMKELIEVLHTTSTGIRPQLNGSSQQFIAEQLGLSKSLISQYLSISSIYSLNVKQMLGANRASIHTAYYISRIKEKSIQETETIQMKEMDRLIPNNSMLTHRLKAAQMILKNISTSKALQFEDVDIKNPVGAAEITIKNIETCQSIIAPGIKRIKMLSEQLGYCNFLLVHENDCKCICGSILDPMYLLQQKYAIIDEMISMHDQIINEKKYTSLLQSAKKDLEAALSSK